MCKKERREFFGLFGGGGTFLNTNYEGGSYFNMKISWGGSVLKHEFF